MEDRDAEFAAFRAETTLQLAHMRESLLRLMPLYEQRSGDLREIHGIKEDVDDLKESVGRVEAAVGKVSESVKRMLAVVVGLQIAAAIFMWLLDKGLVQLGGPP